MANTFFGGNLWNADFRFSATDFFGVGACGAVNGLVSVEARQQIVLRAAGTISFFTVDVTNNTSAANVTVKLRNQSGNLNSTLPVNTGSGQFQDATHSDSMAVADKLDGSPTGGTALSHLTISPVGMKWAPSSGTNSFLTGVHSGAGLAASTTYYLPFSGSLGGASNGGMSSEAIAQALCRAAFTASNLFCEVAANTNTNAVTYDFRNNAGSGTQTLSIGSGVTGYQEDTTHSDSIVPGDKFNCRMVFGAGTIGFTPQLYGVMATYGATSYELLSSNSATANTLSTSADGYLGLLGQYENAQGTESKAQTTFSHAETFQKLRVYVETANSAFTIKFRVNGSTVNQTTGTLGSTGWAEDTTHSDTIVANDLVTITYVHGAGSVSIKSLVITGGVTAVAYTLTAAVGSYTLSGQTANLPFSRKVSAATGSYTLSGKTAGLLRGARLTAGTGVYTLSGQSGAFHKTLSLSATTGSYILSGKSVNINKTLTLAAEHGAYVLTGFDISKFRNIIFPVTTGHYKWKPQSVLFRGSISSIPFNHYVFVADQGEYILTGSDALLGVVDYRLVFSELSNGDFLDWNTKGGVDYSSFMKTMYILPSDPMTWTQIPYIYVFLEDGATEDDVSLLLTVIRDWADTGYAPKTSSPIQTYRFRDGFLLATSKNKVRGKGRVYQLEFQSELGKDFNLRGWAGWVSKNAGF